MPFLEKKGAKGLLLEIVLVKDDPDHRWSWLEGFRMVKAHK